MLSHCPKNEIVLEIKLNINELVRGTENSVWTLEPKVHNIYIHLANNPIKGISINYDNNKLHKRHQYKLNKI